MIAFSGGQRPKQLLPGQIVYHVRYKYRGVIVHCDDICKAGEAWYQKNQTQPDRDQPWYHVLVHNTSACTYVAAVNLVLDVTALPIEHPLLARFFHEFADDHYTRNDEPWPMP